MFQQLSLKLRYFSIHQPTTAATAVLFPFLDHRHPRAPTHPTQPPGHSVTLPAPVAVPVDKSTPRWSPRDPTKAICSPTQPHCTSLQSTFSDHPQHTSTPEQGITFGRPSGLYKLLPLMLEVSELAAGGHLHLYRDPNCLATSLSLPINSNTLQPPPVVPGTISV